MRLSDLSKLRAVDRSGASLGSVRDVRLERRGCGWEVTEVLVGGSAFADRMGFAYGAVQRPALLRLLVGWLTRDARIAPWSLVTIHEDRLVVDREITDLHRVGDDAR